MQYFYNGFTGQSKQNLTTFSVVDIAMTDDFIMTIDSGDEEVLVLKQPKGKQKAAEMGDETVALDPSFSFDLTGDVYADILDKEATFQDVVEVGSKPVRRRARCC
jgi:hypothetical protein